MIRIVVSSFYNTLINYEEAIPTSTMLEIDRIRNKKVLFTVSTNGLYNEILEYNKDFPFVDYIISLNGSYVYDVLNNKCIYKQKIAKNDIKKIYNSFKNYTINYYTENSILNSYNETLNKDIYKIEIEDFVNINIENINCNLSVFEKDNKKYLEIISNKCNSYIALSAINEIHNIKENEILVITGNDSDIELCKKIKNSYIVDNSSDRLKKEINKKTTTNNEYGVEKVIRNVIK
ncbi:MAG: HAD family phosphatase [Bacilli bacterium]|nr:HAD family phosphatase [Bacilli bacterium]